MEVAGLLWGDLEDGDLETRLQRMNFLCLLQSYGRWRNSKTKGPKNSENTVEKDHSRRKAMDLRHTSVFETDPHEIHFHQISFKMF